MKPLRVALLQILPQGSLEKNLQKGIKACEEAKKAGADIALFPEMWSSGYDMPKDPEEMRKKSVPADSDFVLAVCQKYACFVRQVRKKSADLCQSPYLRF